MSNQEFLQQALEKSFQKPLMTDYNNIDFSFCRDSSGNFIMGDRSACHFAPSLIPITQIKDYINTAQYDVSHSSDINREYKTFCHYFSENIIIPEDSPSIQSMRLWLDLTSVSRQAAQKKRVIATIMPTEFKQTIANMEQGYREALKKIQICEEENLDAVEIALITDFAESYKATMRKFYWTDIIYFFANKKLLRNHLTDAFKIIKTQGKIPPEFELLHTFRGNNHKRFGPYADIYRSHMFSLIGKLQNMAHNASLLELAELYMQHPKQYTEAFNTFRNQRRAPNLSDILAIKKSAQIMFDEFTKLCYLEGVRRAFEINYIDECPFPQNPQLTSVAPNEEIGKIRNIVESSRQIDCRKTKTGCIYHQALENYRKAYAKIDKILIDYVGIPNTQLES